MDWGGVRIFRYIEQHLALIGVSLQPHMMNTDLLWQVGSKAQRANRIGGDMTESAIAERASLIEQAGMVHEQEEFNPQSPLAAFRRAQM